MIIELNSLLMTTIQIDRSNSISLITTARYKISDKISLFLGEIFFSIFLILFTLVAIKRSR